MVKETIKKEKDEILKYMSNYDKMILQKVFVLWLNFLLELKTKMIFF